MISSDRRSFVGGPLGFIARVGGAGSAPPPDEPALVSIDVTPNTPTVQVAATQQMTATGTYDDAATDDLTGAVTWSSSDEGVATVDSAGLVTGVAEGTATITATLGAISGNEDVDVEPAITRATIALTAAVANGASTTDGTTFNTASFTPVVGQVYYVACAPTGVAEAPALNHDGFSDGFTQIAFSRIGATSRQVTAFRGVATDAVADTVTMTYGSSQVSALWSVITGTGIDATGTDGANSVVQTDDANSNVGVTTLNTTLAAFEHETNANLTFVMLGGNSSVTPDGDFAELGDVGIAAGTGTLETQWATNQTTCDPSWASTTVAMLSIEIKSGVV